ncbi:hypothetical protein [Chenggangzhangella methanolivorans]|uniref:Uncharacterized protein n=2 Tax=Chenggangzhangella methanolivorans TaxID=1437009 RepID=A0A9E6RH22_9HYPH|nr:hypothetical protein [Chenggangzhangella methanolivorans]QZO00892.1 hypothetical protein K6K41_04435 [Chenggangzhangella methanolivorans]
MSASTFLNDCDFDALVDTLHALTNAMRDRGDIDRWQIRLALGEHGVAPAGAAGDFDERLAQSLGAARRGWSGRDAA